jgi:spermidine synthase
MSRSILMPLTIFLGSFLLFFVQPMMGRMLLPSFGGSAAVWTVCLAAYQILLLAGYGYAHGLARWPLNRQRRLHGCLLALAVAWMCGLLALRSWLLPQAGGSSVPPLEVLACVVLGVGLPYVLLASGSSLLQAWLAQRGADRGVYGLYAVSNLGSLLGLFAYPLAVEPHVPLTWQLAGWTAGLLAYTLLVVIVAQPPARSMQRAASGGTPEEAIAHAEERGPRAPSTPDARQAIFPGALSRAWLWFALPACSCYLLVAVTNHLSLDVEPVPLMWVFLLGAFLLSYTIGFSGWAHKALPLWVCLAAAALGVQSGHGVKAARGGSFLVEMLRGGAVLLLAGTFLHSWLFRIRPHTGRLTAYYLGIAAGGAFGGAAASLLSPVLFRQVLEYPLALVFCAALVAWFVWRLNHRELAGLNEAMLLVCLAVPLLLAWQLAGRGHDVIYRARNFYGALRVTEPPGQVRQHSLMNGETLHGLQSQHPRLSRLGTTYYGPLGGGLALSQHPAFTNRALRVGVIGLGAGTLAVYGRTNDVYRFLEINPQVVAVAGNTNLFTYLADCPAQVQLAVGDARRTLAAEDARRAPLYDVLAVDAYSGDAIPIHLATREAFQLYLRRLAPDGILAVHISNWHIDLLPLCKAMGRDLNLCLLGAVSDPQPGRLTTAAHWVLMTRTPLPMAGQVVPHVRQVDWAQVRDMRTPTDETGSLLQLVRFSALPPLQEVDVRTLDINALFR